MRLIAILNDIRSVHNVGSIFRTADGAGFEKIYLCGITPSPLDRFKEVRSDFAKVALGAEKHVPWETGADAKEVIYALKKEGYEVLALEQAPDAIPYYDEAPKEDAKLAILLGAEVDGLPAELLASVDRVLEIPMRGSLSRDAGHPKLSGYGKESLNVSVAFGIVAFGMRYNKEHAQGQ